MSNGLWNLHASRTPDDSESDFDAVTQWAEDHIVSIETTLAAERDALAKEQVVSDKLEKALQLLSLYVAHNGDDWVKRQATAVLAEVATIRTKDK